MNFSIEPIKQLLSVLGNPQDELRVVHITGTNGKGSVAAYLSFILTASGYKTSRFNSPHLIYPFDAIKINDMSVSENIYKDTRKRMLETAAKNGITCSNFEITTAVAFTIFQEEGVDICIIECGMGGLMDATNVCKMPLVCVFTMIGLDHIDYLGDTVTKISKQKAGILRQGCSVVIGPQLYPEATLTLEFEAKQKCCTIYHVARYPCLVNEGSNESFFSYKDYLGEEITYLKRMQGDFQIQNAAVALATIDVLRRENRCLITTDNIKRGMNNVSWAGRLELINTKHGQFILDGAHNAEGASALANFIDKERGRYNRICWIFAASNTKKPEDILSRLVHEGDILFITGFTTPEEMPWVKHYPVSELAQLVRNLKTPVELLSGAERINEEIVGHLAAKYPTARFVVCGSQIPFSPFS